MKVTIRFKGGEGSGNYNHAGRPGEVGGSQPENGSTALSNDYPKANPDGKDTMEQYMNADGTWTKERQALHDKIKASFFEGKKPVDNPVSYMLGGGPAAGKSTLVNSGLISLPENMVLAAGDDIKAMLPEYDGGKQAHFVHEESSYLAKQIMQEASAKKYNVLMDGTGDGSPQGVASKIKQLSMAGQPVRGIYVTVDVETAVQRNIDRAKRTGRYLPESVLRENHAAVSAVFPTIAMSGLFQTVDLYDTSSGKAIRIAHAESKKLDVIDKTAWQKFLDKAFVKKG